MSDHPSRAEKHEARAANEAMLHGYWQRAMVALVDAGVPWDEAATAMLTISAQNIEHATSVEAAERSLTAAAGYMRGKREASEKLDRIASSRTRN